MKHEELRAILLRPEAVRRMASACRDMLGMDGVEGTVLHCLPAYADEAARTILQAQAGEQDERDAAVRALLEAADETYTCVQSERDRLLAAAAAVRALFPEGA